MNDPVKVIELLRYNLNSNVERVAEKVIRESRESSNDTFSAVFATGFSLISSEIGSAFYSLLRSCRFADKISKAISNDSTRHFLGVLAKASLVFLVFLITFIVTYSLMKKIHSWWNKRRRENQVYGDTEIENKRYIDDFDHIACDALLFAKSFLDESGDLGDQRKIFNLYEAMYYLGKAQTITLIIINNPEKYVSSTLDTKIAEHRLLNAVKIMDDINSEIDKKIEKATILAEAEKKSLACSQKRLSESMNSLKEKAGLPTGESQ